MSGKILTIGIPTYNRSEYLDRCLSYLLPQTQPYSDIIDLLVCDNASVDNTKDVVDKYLLLGYKIDYIRHSQNLGMDGNFISIYNRAKTKYVWELSDDDILVDQGLSRIMEIIQSDYEFGVLYLSNIWISSDLVKDLVDIKEETRFTLYDNPLKFLDRVNYYITFLSGNIFNKKAIAHKINPDEFQGSFLALVNWNINAVFSSEFNFCVENQVLICRAGGQGGYRFIQVFGINFNKILDSLISKGLPLDIKTIINNHLLMNYFPSFIQARRDKGFKEKFKYHNENWFSSLFKVYFGYKGFYLFVLPSFILKSHYYGLWRRYLKKYFMN